MMIQGTAYGTAYGAPQAKTVVPKKRLQGENIPYQRINSPTGRTPSRPRAGVVLLVRDRAVYRVCGLSELSLRRAEPGQEN